MWVLEMPLSGETDGKEIACNRYCVGLDVWHSLFKVTLKWDWKYQKILKIVNMCLYRTKQLTCSLIWFTSELMNKTLGFCLFFPEETWRMTSISEQWSF